MRIIVHADPAAFLARAQTYLETTVLENNVAIGIAHRALRQPGRYPHGVWTATLEVDGRVVGVSLHTPPWPLLVSPLDDDGVRTLADAVRTRDVHAATGPEPAVRALAGALGACIDESRVVRQRLYALRERPAAPAIPGRMRSMHAADRAFAIAWLDAFYRDVGEHHAIEDRARTIDLGIADRQFFLWEDDGGPASMANRVETPPDGCRIGAVYTPPDRRRRGSASALVAALSRASLDEGRPWCCLYTDLANPTSNSIYRKIGYRPVLDIIRAEWPMAGTAPAV